MPGFDEEEQFAGGKNDNISGSAAFSLGVSIVSLSVLEESGASSK